MDFYSLDVLNSLTAHIAVVDSTGTIIAVNQAWKNFATQNGGTSVSVGTNYIDVCQRTLLQNHSRIAKKTIKGIQQVLDKEIDEFELEYDCHSPEEKRWFLMRITPMTLSEGKAVISHINITKEKITQQKLIQKEEELSAIHTIGRELISSTSLEDIIGAILDQISKNLDPDMCLLFLRKGQDLHLAGMHQKNKKCSIEANHFHRVGECLCGISVSSDNAVYSTDIHADPRCTLTECKNAGITSFTAIPLKCKDKIIGTLGIASIKKRDFKDKRNFLEAVAHDVAIALDNSLLYDQVLQNSKKLETELSERKRAQEALQKSELKHKSLIKNIPGMVYMMSPDGSIELASGLEKICGYTIEELNRKEKKWFSIIHPEDLNSVLDDASALRSGPRNLVQLYRITTKTGEIRWVEDRKSALFGDRGRYSGADGIVFDVTDPKKAEKENSELANRLQHVQKMESIGTLAGGIAHDFNNILSAMLGYTDLAISDLPENSRKRQQLKQVLKAGWRAKDLVRQILTFSRNDERQLIPIKIQPIIKDCLTLLKASIQKTIDISTDIDGNCKNILADPTLVHQVVMNLCTNAYHAMKNSGGILGIALHPIRLRNQKHVDSGTLKAGLYLKLEVADTGGGMDQSIQDKIFEPYFTTRDKDEGTGLGLSVVHGIIKSLDGGIDVQSTPGKGTRFTVYFPETKKAHTIDRDEGPAKPIAKGTGHILLIDDEANLLHMNSWIIEELGYEVTAKNNGVEALETFKTSPADFDLIITDMTMPKMTGTQLAKHILDIRPGMPIIICTGHSELINADQARELGIRGYLEKPILMATLANMIKNTLDGE